MSSPYSAGHHSGRRWALRRTYEPQIQTEAGDTSRSGSVSASRGGPKSVGVANITLLDTLFFASTHGWRSPDRQSDGNTSHRRSARVSHDHRRIASRPDFGGRCSRRRTGFWTLDTPSRGPLDVFAESENAPVAAESPTCAAGRILGHPRGWQWGNLMRRPCQAAFGADSARLHGRLPLLTIDVGLPVITITQTSVSFKSSCEELSLHHSATDIQQSRRNAHQAGPRRFRGKALN